MTERYEGRAGDITAPVRRGFAITPSDGADLPAETRALYIGGAGSMQVVLSSGDLVTFVGLTAGTVLPLRALRVKATGTTATQLLGLY